MAITAVIISGAPLSGGRDGMAGSILILSIGIDSFSRGGLFA